MRPKMLDLVLVSLVALFTLGVAFSNPQIVSGQSTFPYWFLPFGILMVLLLPGYALTMGLLPDLDLSTTLLLSLGLSIALNVLGALVLHFTPWGLQPISWAVWLSAMTLLGCLSAVVLRSRQTPVAAENIQVPPLGWKGVSGFILAGILIVLAVLLARNVASKPGTLFTQLWALPMKNGEVNTIQIGIRNQENTAMSYRVYVETRGTRLDDWSPINLAPGQEWVNTVTLNELPPGMIQIFLYKVENPLDVYRMVQISPTAFEKITPSPVSH